MKIFVFAFIASCASMVPAFSQTNDCDALETCQTEIKMNPRNSLVHYRLGEILFQMQNANECYIDHSWPNNRSAGCKNLMEAANSFWEALNGNLDPSWIEVWAHVNLGKIFDMNWQRRTSDNSRSQIFSLCSTRSITNRLKPTILFNGRHDPLRIGL